MPFKAKIEDIKKMEKSPNAWFGQRVLEGPWVSTPGKPISLDELLNPPPGAPKPAQRTGPTSDIAQNLVNPANQVAQDFSVSVSESGNGGFPLQRPDFSMQSLPAQQITPGDLPGMFAPLVADVQGEAAPIGRPEPNAY